MRQRANAWSPGQAILNDTGAASPSTPSTSRCPSRPGLCEPDDGEERIETVALEWTGRDVYVRMSDTRYQLRAVWLDAADVTRR